MAEALAVSTANNNKIEIEVCFIAGSSQKA